MKNETISILIVNNDPDMLQILALSLALDPAINLTLFCSVEDVHYAALEPKDYDVVLVAAELANGPGFRAFNNLFLANSVSKVTSIVLIRKGSDVCDFGKTSILSEFDTTISTPFDPIGLSITVRQAHEKA